MVFKRKVGRKRVRLPTPRCYSVTVFTRDWRQVRAFYTGLLGGSVVSERDGRYCDLVVGGVPLCFRTCEDGEGISHFHLYFAVHDREPILERLQEAGVIVRLDAAYALFLDPEGRTIKLSRDEATLR